MSTSEPPKDDSVPIVRAFESNIPQMKLPDRRNTKAPSTHSRDLTDGNRKFDVKDRLWRLHYDEEHFKEALSSFDTLVRESKATIRPVGSFEDIQSQLRRNVLEIDTQCNFHLAVGGPALKAIKRLEPPFSLQAGDGDSDVTDDSWRHGTDGLVNVEFKTDSVLPDKVWNEIVKRAQANELFYWPELKGHKGGLKDGAAKKDTTSAAEGQEDEEAQQTRNKRKRTDAGSEVPQKKARDDFEPEPSDQGVRMKFCRVICQIWCQMIHWKVDFAILSTYERTMLFARVKSAPNVLLCSRVYRREELGNYTTSRLLATMVLGALWDKKRIQPKEGRVRFNEPELPPPTSKLSPLCPMNTDYKHPGLPKVVPIARAVLPPRPTLPDSDTFKSLFNRKSECPTIATIELLKAHRILMRWKARPYDFGPEAFVRLALGLPASPITPPKETRRPTPELTRSGATVDEESPPNSATDNQDVCFLVNEHITRTRIGFVGTGWISGGIRLAVKVTDGDRVGLEEMLVAEARNYRSAVVRGLGQYIPECFGVFQNDDHALLLTRHVGTSFGSWSDLSDEQWSRYVEMVSAFHSAGLHHGDLRPQNVCVDDDGRLWIIDLAELEKCDCELAPCDELKKLEEDSERKV